MINQKYRLKGISMPSQSRLGDQGTGHESWPPTNVIAASTNCMANGKGCARVGDPLQPHPSPSPSPAHPRSIAQGSSTVFINSKAAARIGDPIDCGGFMAQGSENINVGG